jgi:NADPH2:quinone reductase
MRAAVYRETGAAADVLEVSELPVPEPGPGQVQVRVAVSAVNPTDVKSRAGRPGFVLDGFQVPHMDGAGTIEAVGPGVDEARVGERVWLVLAAHENRYGTAAEYCVVPSSHAVPLPEGISLDLGATLGVPAVTAAHCLFADGPVTGLDVLVAGGAGAVGRAAVQLGVWGGARVAATVSTPAKAQVAAGAGAHLVVSYRDADVVETLRSWSTGFARVVEVSPAANAALDLQVVGLAAVIVAYATDGGDPVIPAREALWKSTTLRYILLYNLDEATLSSAVHAVDAALRDQALDLPPVQRFTLDDVVAAHEAQEHGPSARILLDLTS